MWRERQAQRNNNASDPKSDLNSHSHLHKETESLFVFSPLLFVTKSAFLHLSK